MDWSKFKSNREYTIKSYVVVLAILLLATLLTIPGWIGVAMLGWKVGVAKAMELFWLQAWVLGAICTTGYEFWRRMLRQREET